MMTLRKIFLQSLLLVAVVAVVTTLHSCARMGHPDGGWFDDTPPKVVRATPADRGINVKDKRVTIEFDEYIKIDDPTNKVVVSPPQLEMPEIKTSGKKIVIDLIDSLKANTTYTIDFADAISDNNEGNPMGNFTYSFSTGTQIDTFEVAGTVLDASNLEPVKGILVGMYDNLSDTAFTTQPILRVSRTNSAGKFVIKGVAPGQYRIYALQDMDGDYKFSQKSEMIAFRPDIYTPTCGPDVRQDTIWRDSLRIDSIIRTPYTHYYPDDVVLLAFKEKPTDRYLIKTDRTEADRLGVYFTVGADTLPSLRGLNFQSDSAFVVESSIDNDSIIYWLKDTALVNKDSLFVELTYMMTDTTGLLVNRCDTIEFIPKYSYERRKKLQEDEYEKWLKAQKKKWKREQKSAEANNDSVVLEFDSVMPPKSLEAKIVIPSGMSPVQNIHFEMPVPLSHLDTAGIHLYSKHDTLWYNARYEFTPVEGTVRQYILRAEWRPGVEYSLEIDSMAFMDIYGHVNDPIKKGIQVATEETFGSLFVNISGTQDTTIVVEMLDTGDKPVRSVRMRDGSAEFYYLAEGQFYLRAFNDRNQNGIWDTGEYATSTQPEQVWYNPRTIECKAKWDVTIEWNLNAHPFDKQKPLEITKQKPEQEKKRMNRNKERANSLGIEYKP